MKHTLVIVGAGLAGLSAALTAVKNGWTVKLVSSLASERAQSVMAEGGINAALNTKGEEDSPEQHYADTLTAACGLADPNAVWGMTQAAPELVHSLHRLGVQFNVTDDDELDLRNFGGQKKKRTAFAQSDTGKQLMTALIDAVRREESAGTVERFPHHKFRTLLFSGNICGGCTVQDTYTGELLRFVCDAVLIATGGPHGLFGDTTGSLANTGEVTAELFRLGVPMANLEMIQYHPTTVEQGGKRMLLSEAARGEGGRLTEEFFPDHEIRLVAVSDNIDTAEGENELAPIRNLFNEWYARDISKKRRISNKIKGNSGEPMGLPPYGYIKDPNNPKHWVIDEEAAQVVRRIFDMTLEGFGTEQIATQFEKEGILTPQAYWIQKGIGRPGRSKIRPATKWNGSTITHLLYQQEYCGDVLNFKTYSKSYKNKKRIHNDPENWVVFQDVHEPIIERAVFEQVQQKRGKMRKRRTSNGEHNMFSGLLVCADCGCNLHFHFNQGNPEIKYFNCSNYKGNRGTCQSTHYIRVDFLEEVVLGEIRRLTKFASLYEDDFLKAVIGHSQQADEADRKLKEKELKALLARDEELDGLFERIYEDNVSGKISDERFSRMSRRYEDEQKELTEKIKQLRSEIEKQSSRTMTTDMFISLVRKYTRAKKLTPRMLNELVEKIEVFNAEKVNGVWEQRLRIHYNCVGTIEIPSALPLPTPDVSVNTRKGVVVNYAPCDVAI